MIEASPFGLRVKLGFCLLGFLFLSLLWAIRVVLLQGLPSSWYSFIAKPHWFEIQDLRIQTEPPLKPEVLLRYLPPLKGQSLLAIRPTELYEKIKDQPWVEEISIKKEYPNRLSIRVEPKRARAISFQEGVPYFVDQSGRAIERVPKGSPLFKELPFINGETLNPKWKFEAVLSVYRKLKEQLGKGYEISEVQLVGYPQFKVFFSKPRVEVLFSIENWEEQVPYLITLLVGSASQIYQIQKINLLFSKKAIVTRPFSN